MPYRQISVTAPIQFAGPLAEMLMRHGSLGTIEHDDGVTAYFDTERELRDVVREIEVVSELIRRSAAGSAVAYTVSVLPDADWNESWKRQFPPVPAGDRYLILPPWERSAGDRVPIIIEPGMAFGTGHHATTRSCIALMERWARRGKKDRFLDIGTGTGILAIAAHKIGYWHIEGIDTDLLAVEAARVNCRLNGADTVQIRQGELSETAGRYDMVVANLLSQTLIRSASGISGRLAPGGCAILSGILREQEDEVREAALRAGMRCGERMAMEKWVSLAMGTGNERRV